jgi:hypothetical protein
LTAVVELVGHQTRAGILLALADRQRERPREPALGFAHLRRVVGHNDPGNFNYHLQRLVGVLVTKTAAGYRLSNVGQRFVGSLRSGRYGATTAAVGEGGPHEVACPVCGAVAAVGVAEGSVRFDCPADHAFVTNVAPELLSTRGLEATLRLAMHRVRYETQSIRQGICPLCDGPMAGSLATRDDREPAVACTATCERCGLFLQSTVGALVLDHPAVVSLCYSHGLDVRDDAWTVLREHVGSITIVEKSPLRVTVEVAIGEESRTLALDGDATVVEVQGRSSEAG